MYSATIGRDKDGTVRIMVRKGDPRVEDGVTLVEVLYGDDEEELKARAVRFAKERLS